VFAGAWLLGWLPEVSADLREVVEALCDDALYKSTYFSFLLLLQLVLFGRCSKIVKEVVHRESHASSDKPFASPAVFNSPLAPVAVENSPAQSRSSLDGTFRSPFLLSGPPDVFNSPSVKCSRSVEASRRRPLPYSCLPEQPNKKMKLHSNDLPDSGSSPAASEMLLTSAANNTSPSHAMLCPLSPIRSPTADESSNSVLSQVQSASPELDALLSSVVDSSEMSSPPHHVDIPDTQVGSSDAQVCSPGSETTATLVPHQLLFDEVPPVSSESLPSCSPPEGSAPPEPHPRPPPLPESPASLSSPDASSPEPASYSPTSQEPLEPEIQSSSPTHQPESDVCSSTMLPASAADLSSSSLSRAEAEQVDADSETESGEKLAESAESSSAEAQETCRVTETLSSSASDKGTAFQYCLLSMILTLESYTSVLI